MTGLERLDGSLTTMNGRQRLRESCSTRDMSHYPQSTQPLKIVIKIFLEISFCIYVLLFSNALEV